MAEFYAGVGAIGLSLLGQASEVTMNELSVHALHGLHRVFQPFQRLAIVGAFGVAASVASVNFLVRIEEEDHERDIVIEFK